MMKSKLDIKGVRFGSLVALAPAETKSKTTYWLCECDCGNKKIIARTSLIKGLTTSCGCRHHPYKDLSGQRFGRLTVLRRDDKKWKCKCDCGQMTNANSTDLIEGNTCSCGCLRKETAKAIAIAKANKIFNEEYPADWASKLERLRGKNE